MGQAIALIVTGFGVNSQDETARACTLAGFDEVELAHFADLVSGERKLPPRGLLVFPGGFLDGDDLGAAQAAAIRWRHCRTPDGATLLQALDSFLGRGGLVLGICNGFQLLVKLGVLPALNGARFTRQVSLGHNDSGRFEDRWVRLAPNPASPCIFTRRLPVLYFPARHGEGKIVASREVLDQLAREELIALQYSDRRGQPTMAYPANPNGSPMAIAGLTDPTGQVLGLMPHPEAFHHATNHPGWTRGETDPPGTLLFVNAARHLRETVGTDRGQR